MLQNKDAGQIARDYITRRALPREVVETERLGYALPAWDGLANHLARSGVDPELGLKAGLLARSSKDNERFYDRFRNRLIFPIRDERNRIVAFGGRILSTNNPDEPKYLNSPETPVYHKGRMLYQSARAREACRQVRQVLLVEGYMDLLAFHSHEFYRVVATLGTALTAFQVRLLSRLANEVVLAYDADDAGERAMLRALPLFLQEELAVSCLRLPKGMDPDDLLRTEGIAGLDSLIAERKDLGFLAIEKALEGWDGTTAGKTRILSELQPVFEAIRQPVVRADYIRILGERLSLSEDTVLSQLRHDQRQSTKQVAAHRKTSLPKLDETQSIEENILRVLVTHPELLKEVKDSGAIDYFQEPPMRAILEVLLQTGEAKEEMDQAAIFDLLPDDSARELYTRLRLDPCDIKDPTTQMLDWLEVLPRRKARQDARHLNEALRRAVEEGDSGRVNAILLQIQKLNAVRKRKDSADHV
jgi:DNA primase